MYQPPYNIEEIKQNYPERARELLNDPVHRWRAATGIELIHEEPTRKEQFRIWENWQQMSIEQKKLSDQKSPEFFGLSNIDHHKQISKKHD